MPATTDCSGSSPYGGAFTGSPFADFLLDQVSGKGRGSQSDAWTHLHNRIALLRSGRLQGDPGADPQPRPAMGVYATGRRGGQPAIQLRPDQRPADPGAGRRPRESCALQGVQEGLRAAPRVRVSGGRPVGLPRRLRDHPVHGGHRRQPSAAAEPAVLLRVGGDRTMRRPVPERWPRALRSCGRSTSRRARCARGIRTCARS